MDCLLIFPPGWDPYQPYLSLPLLKSELDHFNVSNQGIDANILFYEYLTSDFFLKKLINNECDHKKFKKAIKAKSVLKGQSFYKKNARNKAFENIESYLNCINQRFPLLDVNSSYLKIKGQLNDALISKSLNNYDILPYYSFYENLFSSTNLNCKIIGISLVSIDQIIPTLILLKYVKSRYPDVHIILGGNTAQRLCSTLQSNPLTKDLFDSISLEKNASFIIDFLNSPSIHTKEKTINLANNNKETSTHQSSFQFNSIIPNFDDLPLDLYWSPKLVLPLQLSFGCPWGKCTFCEEKESKYIKKNTDILVTEIISHMNKYKTNLFSFIDDSLIIKQIHSLNYALKKKGIKISWRGMLRADNISISDAKAIKESGGEFIMLGIESGSQNILNLLNKGISIESAEETLKNLAFFNIWNHCFFMFKMKDESFLDSKKTLDFLSRNNKTINSFAISTYIKTSKNPASTIDEKKWILHEKNNESNITEFEEDLFCKNLREVFDKQYKNFEIWLSMPINHLFIHSLIHR